MATTTRARWLTVLGAALLIAAAVAALTGFDEGDSYCGRVAWDASREGVCGDAMAARTAITVVLLLGAVISFGFAFAWSASAALAGIAIALVLVGANRLLEPKDDPHYCGSLLNRHRTYEPARERTCDAELATHRNEAIGAFVAAAAVAGSSVVVRSRRVSRSSGG